MLLSKPLRVGLATAALILAAAAPAAATEYYGVDVDAVVTTSYSGSASTPEFEHDSSLSLSTRLTAGFLATIDRGADGRILGATGEEQHHATTSGSISTREREFHANSNDWYERASECVGAGESKNDEGRMKLMSDPLTPLVGGALILNLADRLSVLATCEHTGRHGGAGPRGTLLESPLPEDEFSGLWGPLAVSFSLPPEATAAGKVIQLFEGPAGGQAAYCPDDLAERAERKSCTVTFRGTITLEKLDLFGEQPRAPSGPPTQPPVAQPPVTPPSTQQPPRAPAGDDAAANRPRLPGAKTATLEQGGARLRFQAACPRGCAGTAAIRVPVKAGSKRLKTIATVRVRVPRGSGARAVRLTVPRGARAALRRAGGVVVLRLRAASGGGSANATLRVARPR